MDGYSAFREAARRGAVAADAEPVLVEDFPSLSASPRNACLDGVASSDGLVLLVSGRGGWRTPSGKLAVEEEFEEAQRLRKIVLVFIEEAERDDAARALEERVSSYVHGHLRATYENPEELQSLVEIAVKRAFGGSSRDSKQVEDRVAGLLKDAESYGHDASIRLVVTPERDEQVFDPVEFDEDDFRKMLNELGHAGDAPLFSFEFGKQYRGTIDSYCISQRSDGQRAGPGSSVDLMLVEDGTVVIDLNVSGSDGDHRNAFRDSMTVAESAVQAGLATGFAFVARLFDHLDRFGRHQRFWYNVTLHNLGHRTLSADSEQRQSYAMRMHGDQDLQAFPRARVIGREDLADPSEQMRAVVAMLRRQLT